jgi:RNA polymerase sigma-54 factor
MGKEAPLAMKQGLSLRVSQHLALDAAAAAVDPAAAAVHAGAGQEIQQMLDDNPFLEVQPDDLPRGVRPTTADARRRDERRRRSRPERHAPAPALETATHGPDDDGAEPADYGDDGAPNWEGDGSTETVPDDGEWGGDAPAARNNLGDDDEVDATDLARGNESLQSWLHRQALALRLSEEDRARCAT